MIHAGWRAEALVDDTHNALEQGLLPASILSDPDIYELEKERIFGRAWVFLAHESEIANPGDYVVRYIVDDSFIVVRDDNGQVQVLFNSCRHRGMQVCRTEKGRGATFVCPYHGWTYRNDGQLIGVPHEKQIYDDEELNKEDIRLISLPRVESHEGWIFGNLDPGAPSLPEYLGDLRWYLRLYTHKSDAGLEVIGTPQRWVVRANWKLGASNFIGDGYHTSTTHLSTVHTGQIVGRPDFLLDGVQVTAGIGGLGFRRLPKELASTRGFPSHIMDSLRRNAPEQVRIVEDGLFPSHGTVFPNLSFLPAASVLKPGDPPVPYFTLRLWRPISPVEIEIWSWFLIERDAPPQLKEASHKALVISFGSSGMLEQDDTENWSSITRAASGQMARRQYFNYRMGLKNLQPMTDWPGPGTAYPLDYTEANERAFFRTWLDYMSRRPSDNGER